MSMVDLEAEAENVISRCEDFAGEDEKKFDACISSAVLALHSAIRTSRDIQERIGLAKKHP